MTRSDRATALGRLNRRAVCPPPGRGHDLASSQTAVRAPMSTDGLAAIWRSFALSSAISGPPELRPLPPLYPRRPEFSQGRRGARPKGIRIRIGPLAEGVWAGRRDR